MQKQWDKDPLQLIKYCSFSSIVQTNNNHFVFYNTQYLKLQQNIRIAVETHNV